MVIYQRHEPEKTVLYQSVARSWPLVSAIYTANDEPAAPHIESEFKRFVRCGILQYGFVRLRCSGCDKERVVAYSCKCRGFCASCGSKRMEQTGLFKRDIFGELNIGTGEFLWGSNDRTERFWRLGELLSYGPVDGVWESRDRSANSS